MTTTIIDPLLRLLYLKLVEELDSRVTTLARGSALIQGERIGVDPTATAMKYQEAVSYIQALQAVMDLILETDRERYKKENGDE